jgi:hypothetical protein
VVDGDETSRGEEDDDGTDSYDHPGARPLPFGRVLS